MPDTPEQPKTTQLPAVPAWAVDLTTTVKAGIAELRADVALVSNDLGVVKDRVAILESFRNDTEARATRTSAGVRSLSSTNAEQDAQLAQERAAREALAAKTDSVEAKVDALTASQSLQMTILTRLDAITQQPLVKTLAAMLATAAITWLASRGISIK